MRGAEGHVECCPCHTGRRCDPVEARSFWIWGACLSMLHRMTRSTGLTRERETLLRITRFLSTEDHRRNRKGQQASQGTPPSHNHAPHDCASSGRPLATILSPRMAFSEPLCRSLWRRRPPVRRSFRPGGLAGGGHHCRCESSPARLLRLYSTVNVVHMPLAKWFGMLHDRMYLPGFRFKVSLPELPGSVSSTSPSEPALSSLNFPSFSS